MNVETGLGIEALDEAATEVERMRAVAGLVADWRQKNPDAAAPGNRQLVRMLSASMGREPPGVLDGQLVDGWRTPYWITSSGEVRSAGADRTYYTLDDLVTGRNPGHKF